MSSTTTRSARRIRAMALVTESSARCRRTSAPTCSRVNQATFLPAATAAWPRASSMNVLPVPDGPQTTRFSCRLTHSRVRSAAWVGAGDFLGEQGPDDLGGVPALGLGRGDDLGGDAAHVGQPHAPQELVQAVV